MRFFMVLIGVNDFESAQSTLTDLKKKMKDQGEITVFDIDPINYDFLFNSFSERANAEIKRRS